VTSATNFALQLHLGFASDLKANLPFIQGSHRTPVSPSSDARVTCRTFIKLILALAEIATNTSPSLSCKPPLSNKILGNFQVLPDYSSFIQAWHRKIRAYCCSLLCFRIRCKTLYALLRFEGLVLLTRHRPYLRDTTSFICYTCMVGSVSSMSTMLTRELNGDLFANHKC
jgi:hypothetical protein